MLLFSGSFSRIVARCYRRVSLAPALALALASALLLASCGRTTDNRFCSQEAPADTSLHYSLVRFDKEVRSLPTDTVALASRLSSLRAKYGDFLSDYLVHSVEVARFDGDPATVHNLCTGVLENRAYRFFMDAVDSAFADGAEPQIMLIQEGMSRFRFFFRGQDLPVPSSLVGTFSAFGYRLGIGQSNQLALSLEYYLGSDFAPYGAVPGINNYDLPTLSRDKMPSDAIVGWLSFCFPQSNAASNRLIDQMVYYGRLFYVAQALLPSSQPRSIIGYTTEQWQWCEAFEGRIWQTIKQQKHLYSFNSLLKAKYIQPAPCVGVVSPDSPGMLGCWVGWRIVSAFMNNNQDVTLPQLMALDNAEDLLSRSGYNPK